MPPAVISTVKGTDTDPRTAKCVRMGFWHGAPAVPAATPA